MWIKWKYNDHGHPDFKEMEFTEHEKEFFGNVDDCLCEYGLVPVNSERFDVGRIEWKRICKPSREFLTAQIKDLKREIKTRREKLKRYQSLLTSK